MLPLRGAAALKLFLRRGRRVFHTIKLGGSHKSPSCLIILESRILLVFGRISFALAAQVVYIVGYRASSEGNPISPANRFPCGVGVSS